MADVRSITADGVLNAEYPAAVSVLCPCFGIADAFTFLRFSLVGHLGVINRGGSRSQFRPGPCNSAAD